MNLILYFLQQTWKSFFRSLAAPLRWLSLYWRFTQDYRNYTSMTTDEERSRISLYPCLYDRTSTTQIEPIYFYQDTWAFERIVNSKPTRHVDIGSHHKFVAFLSKITPVTMVDIRPLSLPLNTLSFVPGSILNLPFEDRSQESVSSLCVIEHIGLGRYGDPLDTEGTWKALAELIRVTAIGGNLYVSAPVDDHGRVEFNAHRVLNEKKLLAAFEDFHLEQAMYIVGSELSNERHGQVAIGLYHFRRLK